MFFFLFMSTTAEPFVMDTVKIDIYAWLIKVYMLEVIT